MNSHDSWTYKTYRRKSATMLWAQSGKRPINIVIIYKNDYIEIDAVSGNKTATNIRTAIIIDIIGIKYSRFSKNN